MIYAMNRSLKKLQGKKAIVLTAKKAASLNHQSNLCAERMRIIEGILDRAKIKKVDPPKVRKVEEDGE